LIKGNTPPDLNPFNTNGMPLRLRFAPILFSSHLAFVPVFLNVSWINFLASDCPIALLKSSVEDLHVLIPGHHGDSMTIMLALNTGLEVILSNNTTKLAISSGPKPPLTTLNRWGLKNLFSIYRPIYGKVLMPITNSSIVVLTLISPHYVRLNRTCFQNLFLTTLTIRSLLLISEKTDNLLSSKNCLKPNTPLLDLKLLNLRML